MDHKLSGLLMTTQRIELNSGETFYVMITRRTCALLLLNSRLFGGNFRKMFSFFSLLNIFKISTRKRKYELHSFKIAKIFKGWKRYFNASSLLKLLQIVFLYLIDVPENYLGK